MLQWLLDRGEDPAALTRSRLHVRDGVSSSPKQGGAGARRSEEPVGGVVRAHDEAADEWNIRRLAWRRRSRSCRTIDKLLPSSTRLRPRDRPRRARRSRSTRRSCTRWSKLSSTTRSSHDVTLQTDDGAVDAHVSILSLASPVLERMLSTAMVEGRTKRVAVRDTPKAAMELPRDRVHRLRERRGGGQTATPATADESRRPPSPPRPREPESDRRRTSPPRSARTARAPVEHGRRPRAAREPAGQEALRRQRFGELADLAAHLRWHARPRRRVRLVRRALGRRAGGGRRRRASRRRCSS